MSKLNSHQMEILEALAEGPRVERSRTDYADWQVLEDCGLITRKSVNVSEMCCEITDKGRSELLKRR